MKVQQTQDGASETTAHSGPKRDGSLKLRLFGWFLAVALVPLTVVSAISYYSAKESLRKNAFDAVANDVEQRATFFDNWFRYRLIDLRSQAENAKNTQLLSKLRDAYNASGKELTEFTKSYRWHTLTDQWSEDLKTFQELYEYYDVFLIDDEGNVLFTVAQEDDLGTNLFDGPYAKSRLASACRETLESGRPVFSDLEYYGPSNNIIAGFLAEVMVDENGEKIGVFAIQITPEQIAYASDSVDESNQDLHAYVVGFSDQGDGVTLRSELDTEAFGDHEAAREHAHDDHSSNFLTQHLDTDQTRLWHTEHGPDGVEESDMSEAPFVYVGPWGEEVLGVHKEFHMASVDWGLIAEIPTEVAFAPASRLRTLVISLVMVTGVLVALLAIVITGRIVRPIVRLSNVANLVAGGDLKQRMHTSSTDEIGALSDSFNKMVANLAELFAGLANLRSAIDEHAIVSITDIRGNIVFVNDKFCEISGYSHEELAGRNHRMVKSDEHSPEFYRDLWKTISGGQAWSGEIKNRAKDGTHYWVDATIVPFRDAEGKIEQYVAIRTDITEVKESEDKAKKFAAQLEQTNLELEGQKEESDAMNAELISLNDHLEAARVEAMAATKAKSAFLANMSHEIRTPMTAILGFTDTLREEGDIRLAPKDRIDAIDTIHRNGHYLLTIINDILDMAKIEAGKMEVEHIACGPQEIVADVASLMKVRTDAKGIGFDTEFIGLIPETIHSDPTRLKQILINIIGNAIKFTEEGGVRLIIRFVPGATDEPAGSPNESFMQFDILDTGVGMTQEQAGKLFQAFSQADSTMTRKFGGTGLGLTISKTFAEMLGGDITIVDTKPGAGTRFRTCVATGSLEGVKMIDPMMARKTPESDSSPKTGSIEKPLDCRILLAEDGPDNQRLISFVLKKAGADVTVAENGQIAHDLALATLAEGKPFDVILMDMQMPVMDGYQATKALREKHYEGPIIALTAHAMAEDREKCINAGCDEFATKPIDRQKLVSIIQGQLSRSALPTGAC